MASAPSGPFVLPPLPYDREALAPAISGETIDFHYGKHHAGYVTKLNTLVADKPQASQSLEELIAAGPSPFFNCAAQTWNHTFYWEGLAAGAGGEASGPIADKINASFGSFANFRKRFTETAVNHFGSGWAWLVVKADGELDIVDTHDADCPLRTGLKPLLTCDLWEHAYYIDYKNARPQYVEAWWTLVNWAQVNKRFAESAKL